MSSTMLGVLFCITVACTSPVLGEENTYPVFTSCNSTIIEFIKNYWKTTEIPTNAQKRMEAVGRYVDFHSTYEGFTEHFECNVFEAANKFFNLEFSMKDGISSLNYKYAVTDSGEGILYGKPLGKFDDPHHRWTWYVIHLEDGLEVSYVCNADHGRPTSPLAEVLVADNKKFSNALLLKEAEKLKTMLESWGFKFTFSTISDCFVHNS